MIAVPESVAFYWSEPANRAAVNVLAGKTEMPPDLSLDEAERFEVASLASQRVQLDFWRMLRALWSATFGAAVRAELPSARLLSFGEHASIIPTSDFTPSVARAWSDGETFGVYEVPGHGHLITCLWLDPKTSDHELVVEFYFVDPDGRFTVSDGLAIGPDWGSREGWRTTEPQVLGRADGDTAIHPKPFDTLCRAAMAALAEALKTRSSTLSQNAALGRASKA